MYVDQRLHLTMSKNKILIKDLLCQLLTSSNFKLLEVKTEDTH